ncbi:Angiopoietin-1 [Chionoecetes opilio]|uniref:Angiopoietin-1 n=1 Tax=Chionoecetes opilio TaxID=41210 RepID=A0A8J4XXP7_CHIOP|nr:Angiopoietin-1 [Chionoecetes opilio]
MANIFWLLLAVTLGLDGSKGRTLDGGRKASSFKPQHPMEATVKDDQNTAGPVFGLNDIQTHDIDKDEGNGRIIPTAEPPNSDPPAVEESNNVVDEDSAEEEQPVGDEGVSYERLDPEPEGNNVAFDVDVFQGDSDLVVIMRRMYESLTKRLNSLKSRVTSVEQTARDILARLTVMDCSDLKQDTSRSGIYTFHMDHNGKRPVSVVCDMETDGGGWTVVQRRLPHSKAVDFDREWHDYKVGFGHASTDYWAGLENLYIWTNSRQYELRIHLSDFAGDTAYALYDRFYVEGEDEGYRLHVSGYSGTAGDSLGNEGKSDNFTANGMMFTAHDEDHDTSHEINCAKYWKIGGWWFNRCSWANLNGPYKEQGEGDGIGINWHMWRNKEYLRSSTMMIRPSRNP